MRLESFPDPYRPNPPDRKRWADPGTSSNFAYAEQWLESQPPWVRTFASGLIAENVHDTVSPSTSDELVDQLLERMAGPALALEEGEACRALGKQLLDSWEVGEWGHEPFAHFGSLADLIVYRAAVYTESQCSPNYDADEHDLHQLVQNSATALNAYIAYTIWGVDTIYEDLDLEDGVAVLRARAEDFRRVMSDQATLMRRLYALPQPRALLWLLWRIRPDSPIWLLKRAEALGDLAYVVADFIVERGEDEALEFARHTLGA